MSTKIMGQAQASIEQMRAYIKKVNPKAPKSVLAMLPLYITEGALEGVRGRRCLCPVLPGNREFYFCRICSNAEPE